MNATVNENCIGCGLCAGTCPEVFHMGDDGLAHGSGIPEGQLEAARAEEAVYAQRLAELRETNERLATDIANSDDPELIEEIARDELGMVEQGEKIIRFNY